MNFEWTAIAKVIKNEYRLAAFVLNSAEDAEAEARHPTSKLLWTCWK